MDERARLAAEGVRVVVIGNGRVEHARNFAGEYGKGLPLYTDPTLETYDALGARRGLMSSVHPGVFRRGAEASKRGFSQGATQGTALQQGGALGVRPDGSVWFRQLSDHAGDHFKIEDVITAHRKS